MPGHPGAAAHVKAAWLKHHIQAVAARGRSFYGARRPGHLLVSVQFPVDAPPLRPIDSFDLDRQLGEYLDERLAAACPLWAAKEGLDDDSVPSLCPAFGIAEHSAWLGLEVRLQAWTSLATPVVRAAADLERLKADPGALWFRRMRDAYAHLRKRQDGTFALSVRGTMSPMDLANAVRGDEFFTDVLLDPDFAHALVGRLTGLLPWYYDQLLAWADRLDGGYVMGLGSVWLPGPVLGHLSNDAAMLCGPEIYDSYGYPYEAGLTGRYGRAMYHVHNERMHFIPQLARLPGLALIEITQDPRTVAPIEELPRIFAATGQAALLLHAGSDQIRTHLAELAERNVVLDVACRDRADAEDVIRLVRQRSLPMP